MRRHRPIKLVLINLAMKNNGLHKMRGIPRLRCEQCGCKGLCSEVVLSFSCSHPAQKGLTAKQCKIHVFEVPSTKVDRKGSQNWPPLLCFPSLPYQPSSKASNCIMTEVMHKF
jgi:hypothetical protein